MSRDLSPKRVSRIPLIASRVYDVAGECQAAWKNILLTTSPKRNIHEDVKLNLPDICEKLERTGKFEFYVFLRQGYPGAGCYVQIDADASTERVTITHGYKAQTHETKPIVIKVGKVPSDVDYNFYKKLGYNRIGVLTQLKLPTKGFEESSSSSSD